MMRKKILFWIFLVIGIAWIAGVSYWYIYINDFKSLELSKIKWTENFWNYPASLTLFNIVLFLIAPLLVTALLFYLIGLFSGKGNRNALKKIEEENKNLKNEIAEYTDKIENIKISYSGGKIQKKNKQNLALPKIPPKVPSPENIKKDDLKVIDGIGEKIEFILNENGIHTWEQLAAYSPKEIHEILISFGGPSYNIYDTSKWPEKAKDMIVPK